MVNAWYLKSAISKQNEKMEAGFGDMKKELADMKKELADLDKRVDELVQIEKGKRSISSSIVCTPLIDFVIIEKLGFTALKA